MNFQNCKPGFDTVPTGAWNLAYLVPELSIGDLTLASMAKKFLPTILALWHPRKVDWLTLRDPVPPIVADLQSRGRICSQTYIDPQFGTDHVVVHIEWHPEDLAGVAH